MATTLQLLNVVIEWTHKGELGSADIVIKKVVQQRQIAQFVLIKAASKEVEDDCSFRPSSEDVCVK